MLALYLRIQNWLREQEEGQDLVEYALLLVLIALVVVGAIGLVGDEVETVFTDIQTELGGATAS